MNDKGIWFTWKEKKFIEGLRRKNLQRYVETMHLRKNWDSINEYEIMAHAQKLLKEIGR